MSTRSSARDDPTSATVSAVTRDDNWIMVLEREAPQADLSKETGFDLCAVMLRTDCGQALATIWAL